MNMQRGEDGGGYDPKYEIKPHGKKRSNYSKKDAGDFIGEGLHLDYLSEGGGEKRR